MMRKKLDEEITLTKEEVDNLERTIESLRDYGRAHFNFKRGQLTFNCDEFAKLREKHEKNIKKIKGGCVK